MRARASEPGKSGRKFGLQVDFIARNLIIYKVTDWAAGAAAVLKERENNMNDYILSCCSTADLSAEHFAARDIHEERFPRLDGRVEINHVGTTIGSHTGPGTVALFFWGGERKN